MKYFSYKSSYSRAFTLLEVLVSAAILSIVIAVLLAVLSTTLGTWRTTTGQIEVDNEGRGAHLLLMQDIDNVILPSIPALWPRIVRRGDVSYFQFLTTKPLDYQDVKQGDVGDVCFAEYYLGNTEVSRGKGAVSLLRSFRNSKWTYDNVLKVGSFPDPLVDGQVLSTNLLRDFRDALRHKVALYGEANTNTFVILATNNFGQMGSPLPLVGAYTLTNPPVGVEINFAVTDYKESANLELLQSPSYRPRNSAYFSMRFDFPKAQITP